ncbi:MAG TPA: HEAT repeat domain-containing protein [Polyangiaceae bacterium]|nr:HEAT repeat domain-containing protein [Polyangiaceae bacterium]
MSPVDVIVRRLEDPGYTPARADLGELFEALPALPEESQKRAHRVLLRAGWPAAEAAVARLNSAAQELAEELVAFLGRYAAKESDPRLLSPLLVVLATGSARARRLAASALGKLGDAQAENALLDALASAPLDLARAIVEALGKLGGERALASLRARRDSDPEIVRRREQAELLIERRLGRGEQSEIELDARLPAASAIHIECRRGLVPLLVDELRAFGATPHGATSVRLTHAGTLRDLLRARTALSFGIYVGNSTAEPERIAALVTSEPVVAAVSAWTRGRPRFRIDWVSAGHQRAASWAVAREVSRRSAALVNDPRAATWTLEIGAPPTGELRFVPALEPDPRFAYRQRDVPAASHPTIAAALARMAGAQADDVVWDPFVGSGLELVERALLGPYRKLIGSDLDARALEAARANLNAANARDFELALGDMRTLAPRAVTLVISNPPMGRRVARDGSLVGLLEAFVAQIARTLSPRGRAVFLSPLPARTEAWSKEKGLSFSRGPSVDLGGFEAEIQTLRQTR